VSGEVLLFRLPWGWDQQAGGIQPSQSVEVHERGISATGDDLAGSSQGRREVVGGEMGRLLDGSIGSRSRVAGQVRQASYDEVTTRATGQQGADIVLEGGASGLRAGNQGEGVPWTGPGGGVRGKVRKPAERADPVHGRESLGVGRVSEFAGKSSDFAVWDENSVESPKGTSHHALQERFAPAESAWCSQVKLVGDEPRGLAGKEASESIVRDHRIEFAPP